MTPRLPSLADTLVMLVVTVIALGVVTTAVWWHLRSTLLARIAHAPRVRRPQRLRTDEPTD